MFRITLNARRVCQTLAAVGLLAAAAVLLPVGWTSAETAQMLPAPALDEAPGKSRRKLLSLPVAVSGASRACSSM